MHNYTFNAENRITQMDGGAATYTYDGEGRRMRKTVGPETTYFFYGPSGIISEFTTSNAIASATAASSTDKCFYHTTDKLGSAVLVITASGTVIENNRTLPYGEAWLAESTPSTNDKKFTTYQRDAESNLDYAMDRYLANNSGRFQSPDRGPVSLKQPVTLNRYIYVGDDPVNFHDPSGRSFCPAEFSYAQCGGDAGLFGGNFGEEVARPSPWINGLLLGRFATEIMAGLQRYNSDVQAAFNAADARAALNNITDPNCVQNAIGAASAAVGLDLSNLGNPTVQLVGATDPRGGVYGNTELNLTGSAEGIQGLIDQMCSLGFANNDQCQGGAGNSPFVGPPHSGFTGNFRSPGLANSVQVNTNVATGRVQIDVDPYNPAAAPVLGAILHNVLQVLPNKLTGSDNSYGCNR